jgi:hypothetical protein
MTAYSPADRVALRAFADQRRATVAECFDAWVRAARAQLVTSDPSDVWADITAGLHYTMTDSEIARTIRPVIAEILADLVIKAARDE